MKTLYEILEVSENASKEIIEKAYRVLAKKYHPDLQTEENKLEAEKMMKEINEAYSILSDDLKRKEYDNNLLAKRQEEQAKKQEDLQRENYHNNVEYNQSQNNPQNQTFYQQKNQEYSNQRQMTEEEYKQAQKMQQEVQKEYEQKYQEAYEDYLRSLGYKVKHKWTWKNFKDFLITILIIIVICAILWFLPPTHKWIMDIYNSSPIIKTIVDIIKSIFIGIWNAICSFFTGNKSL